MKLILLILTLSLLSCGGSLSDEQRKEMREKMEMNKIVRVTEVEITEAAFSRGRQIVKTLENLNNDSAKLNSFLEMNKEWVRYVEPRKSGARQLEQQLMEAYLADKSAWHQDNVQKQRNDGGDFDSLLYTKPVVRELPDGGEQLEGVWSIWLPKKDLIMDIGKNK